MNTLQERDSQSSSCISSALSFIAALAYFLACLFVLAAFNATAQTTNVTLAWDASPDATVTGYSVYYGPAGAGYTSSVDAGMNLTATVTGLAPTLTYYFAVAAHDSNGVPSVFSNILTNGPLIFPSIAAQPQSQTVLAGAPVTFAAAATGAPPLSLQWMDGSSPVPGATTSTLSLTGAGVGDAGSYSVVVTSAWGAATSSVAVLSVLVPPSIIQQPQSETVIATTPASLSAVQAGTAPLSIQWYLGAKALAGGTNSGLSWNSVAASNAGNYQFTLSNVVGVVTSSVATVTVASSSTFATSAGAYNGLFFPTNADGSAAVAEGNSGFFGNCVVSANGVFSAKLYLGGMTYLMSGNFGYSGGTLASISQTNGSASSLQAALQLGLTTKPRQIYGTISSTDPNNPWSAPLVAMLATNALPKVTSLFIVLPGSTVDGNPTGIGVITGIAGGGVLSLAGPLGDTAPFSQAVPVCSGGYVPIYGSLYNGTGLLEGWIQLGGGQVTGAVTWIRPSGITAPAGFPNGFSVQMPVFGATTGN